MKFSGLTIVAPRRPKSRATYAPAHPPPTTSVPPRASLVATSLLSRGGKGSGRGDRQWARARDARGGGRPPAGGAGLHHRDRRARRGDGRGLARREAGGGG